MATDANVTLVLTRFPLMLSCVETGKTSKDACWGRLFVVAGCLASARFDHAGFDRPANGKTIEVTTHAGKRTLHLVAEHGEIGAARDERNFSDDGRLRSQQVSPVDRVG